MRIRIFKHYFKKYNTEKVLEPTLIIKQNKNSLTKQGNKYKHKMRKGESTASKSYKKVKKT